MLPPVLGVIPARLGSSRLPRKPLHPLAGRPLIEWVWRRVESLGVFDALVIATDSEEIAEVAFRFGGRCEMTDPDQPSGTDRVAELVSRVPYGEYPIVVNVQGDEPFVREEQLRRAIGLVRDGWDVGTVAAPLSSVDDWYDPAVVKVVRGDAGGALYFSRAPIPHPRDGRPTPEFLAAAEALRHIGVYAYRREALLTWVSLPEGRLERIEKLEQLRALAAGLGIGVAVVEAAEGGVDTPADAKRAELRLLHERIHG